MHVPMPVAKLTLRSERIDMQLLNTSDFLNLITCIQQWAYFLVWLKQLHL